MIYLNRLAKWRAELNDNEYDDDDSEEQTFEENMIIKGDRELRAQFVTRFLQLNFES